MNLLFIADPLDSFKTYKDSTFAMMTQAQADALVADRHWIEICEAELEQEQ